MRYDLDLYHHMSASERSIALVEWFLEADRENAPHAKCEALGFSFRIEATIYEIEKDHLIRDRDRYRAALDMIVRLANEGRYIWYAVDEAQKILSEGNQDEG